MPRPREVEKPKNFFGSMKRLFKLLNPWKYLLIMALTLSFIGTVLLIIAPNKLSDLANEIQKGLILDTNKITEISEKIVDNINYDIDIESLSVEDQITIYNFFNELNIKDSDSDKLTLFLSLPDNILKLFLNNIYIDNTLITVDEEITTIRLLSDSDNITTNIDKLPSNVYELVKPKIDTNAIKNIIIFMAIIYVVGEIFNYIEEYSMATISNKFAKYLRSKISNKINKLPLKYFDVHEVGDVLSRVTNDVDSIAQNLSNSMSTLTEGLTLFLGSLFMMFITNYIMAITAILSTIIGFALMFIILGKSQKYFLENQKVLGELNGYIEEVYAGQMVVKTYNATDECTDEFERLNKKLYKAKRNSIFLSGLMQPIMGFVGNFGYVAVCVVGALLVLNGGTTFGTIVAFMIYIRMFTNPLSQIAGAMTNLQTTAAASERVFEFMDEKEMKDESGIIEKLDVKEAKGNISFNHIKFGYRDNHIIIKDFSAKVKSGQKIAIVGPTGAGKTTMVNLLMKFYDITDGDITIDGKPISNLTRENVHNLFCMVLQDTWLFEGTIRDNIKFNAEGITDEEIWNALKTVGLEHYVKTLPNGLDTVLSESESISSGQKQLFTIARASLQKTPFLILDEATSNVDTRTEELVQKAMDKLMKGRTSFIIAHRLSTIKNADLILVMQKGNIVEQGSHEQLLKQNGFYADLYNSQFEL